MCRLAARGGRRRDPTGRAQPLDECGLQELIAAGRASIYPAVQNIIRVCRALGLGTTITTNHIRCEGEVKAVLGVPDDVQTFALMPIGYPLDKFARWFGARSLRSPMPTAGRSRGPA